MIADHGALRLFDPTLRRAAMQRKELVAGRGRTHGEQQQAVDGFVHRR